MSATHARPFTRNPAPPRDSLLDRHALHRAVDGDWSAERPSAVDHRRALVMGLAVVATLPAVAVLLERWPAASPALAAAIGSLPLVVLLVVALAWRPVGGAS